MKKQIQILCTLTLGITLLLSSAVAQDKVKLAQTGFQFLSVISDAEVAALGGSATALELGSSALFFNPATMAHLDGFVEVSASMNQFIAGINYNAFSAAIKPLQGKFGVLGVTLQSIDYGDNIFGTIVDPLDPKGYRDTGEFSPTSVSLGVGYAKQLSSFFAVGGHFKYATQNLGNTMIPTVDDTLNTSKEVKNELSATAADFGTYFNTGVRSINFGMSVRNYSKEVQFVSESFQLPLAFTLGVSSDLIELITGRASSFQRAVLSMEMTHFRAHPEQVMVGLDYQLMETFAFRAGYVANNYEDDISFGFGINKFGLKADYAYTPFSIFGNVQRITIRFSL